MAIFEGNVSFVETKDGSFKIITSPSGKWNASNIKQGIAALITAKVSLSAWSLWLDVGTVEEKGRKPYSPTELAAFCKLADSIELVLVKRPFPQPKIKITKGGGSKGSASFGAGKRVI